MCSLQLGIKSWGIFEGDRYFLTLAMADVGAANARGRRTCYKVVAFIDHDAGDHEFSTSITHISHTTPRAHWITGFRRRRRRHCNSPSRYMAQQNRPGKGKR